MERIEFENVGAPETKSSIPESTATYYGLDFYTQSGMMHTQMRCPAGFRVLDLFNKLYEYEPKDQNVFIEILETGPANKAVTEEDDKTIIRKETILFVATSDANTGRGLGPVAKGYPVTEKIPVKVEVLLNAYKLTGTAFHAKHKTLKETLNESASFLPLTDVTINCGAQAAVEKPFVAVYKRQIIAIKNI